MAKRSYRSETVKSASKHLFKDVAGEKRIVVGLDIAKKKQYAAFLNKKREVLSTVHFTSPGGNQAFLSLLSSIAAQLERVEVVLESTGTYGDILLDSLRKSGFPVFQIGTKKVHDAQELYDGVPSMHDAKAAMVIARLHFEGSSRLWKALSEEQRALKAVASTFARYDVSYQANTGRLEAQLARAWPELSSELKLTSMTLIKVVAKYGSPQAMADDAEEAFSFMKKIGRSFLKVDKIKKIIRDAGTSVGVPLLECERIELQRLASDTRELRSKRKEVKACLEKLGQENVSAQRIKGPLGKFSTAVMLTIIGDPQDFESPDALMKAFGLNLKVHSSGKKQGQLAIAKRASGLPRRYLYMAALRLIGKNPIVSAWYQRRLERNGYKAKKAIVAVMRKLVRALWKIARTGEAFEASLLFNTQNLAPLLSPSSTAQMEQLPPKEAVQELLRLRDSSSGRMAQALEQLLALPRQDIAQTLERALALSPSDAPS